MPGSQHGPSIKNPRVYEALRRKGMSKRRAAAISNAQRHKAMNYPDQTQFAGYTMEDWDDTKPDSFYHDTRRQKESGVANLAIPPTGPNALFNSPGVGIRSARRRRRRRLKAFNWSAGVGQVISGALTRGEGGRFAGSGQPSARSQLSAAQKKRREEMRAKRQARANERRAAQEQEQAAEDATRAEEDAYIAAGATGAERQRRRAEIAAKRRERAAARREKRRQEAETERATRQQEDEQEAKTREQEAAEAESGKGKGGGGGGGGKKKPTDEEKKAAAEQKKAENRTKTAPQAGLSTDEAEFLAGAASGTLPNGSFDASHLRELGLVEDTGDTTEATDAGRRLLAALEKGDVRAALAAIQDGKAKVKRDQARQQRDEESAKKKRQQGTDQATGSGGKPRNRGPTKPGQTEPRSNPPVSTMPVERTDPTAERERNRTLAQQIIRNLEQRRQRRRKAATVKVQATFGGKPRADLPDSVFAGPDRSFPIVTAQDVRDAVRSLGRTKHDRAAVRRGIIRRARAIGAVDALPESWRVEKASATNQERGWTIAHRAIAQWEAGLMAESPSSPSFTVFKDAAGRDRWASITTTAYQDKDQEWISRKAIRAVVAAGDSGAPRGPLRFWHVPGLDLGDCDYQAALGDGRLLLESGTFRSKAAARIGQEAARRGYQMSPGFVHTRQEPRGGVFDHIALFERSFVPPGRASNPYTRLLTKETRMLTPEKRKEFEELAGDTEGRALLQQLLSQADTTVKERDREGTVYKDAPPWAQALIARLDALETTVKAPMDPASMMDAGATEEDDALAKMDADMGMGDEADPELDGLFADVAQIKSDVAELKALVSAIGRLDEMHKMLGELKGTWPQYTAQVAQKDDARAQQIATLEQRIADQQTRLKTLEGDQPRAARAASWNTQTWEAIAGAGIPVTKEQAAVLATQQTNEPPAGLSSPIEIAAHKALWGDS